MREELDKDSIISQEGSWASLLKESAYQTLGILNDEYREGIFNLWADSFKENHTINITNSIGETIHTISGREFLQRYGTEGHREIFGDNFWIDSFWHSNDFSDCQVLIITDCRFDNEAESVKEKGGTIIKIKNDRAEKETDKHDSESGISKSLIDLTINNSGTIEDLKNLAKGVADRVRTDLKNG